MQGIERRALREITAFMLVDPERYEDPGKYISTDRVYRNLVRALLPAGWLMSDGPGIWCAVTPEEGVHAEQGFKIHVSAIYEDAAAILRAVVPVATEEKIAFKFLVDEKILDYMSSSDCPKASCGKFITLYPGDLRQFERMIERLRPVTSGFQGPYILSDKRCRDSKVLFYRYGAFKSEARVDIFGESVSFIQTADGSSVPDRRLPFFVLPEGVADPFPDDLEEDAGEIVLRERYRITGIIAQSNKGGVYRAVDLETGAEVIIKEGRPFVNRTSFNPHDAVACLKNEHHVLRVLQDSGLTPKPYEMFEEWEHSFLAMERMRGISLASYKASEDVCLVRMTDASRQDIIDYCTRFVDIAGRLVDALREIHGHGVVVHDLAPQNILLDPEMRTLSFVDFESACHTEGGKEGRIVPLRTLGFGGSSALRGARPTVAEDYKALSGVLCDLLFPVTPFFTLHPPARRRVYSHLARERGIPDQVLSLALDIGNSPSAAGELLESARQSISEAGAPAKAPVMDVVRELPTAIGKIADYAEWAITGPRPLDPPTDYRRFTTNALNLSYGVAGIASFLHRVRRELSPSSRDELLALSQSASLRSHPPGLFVGLAGIALAFYEIGLVERAHALMAMAGTSPILYDSLDVFYGAAGVGLAYLSFFDATRRDEYLHQAAALYPRLRAGLQRTEAGYYYPSLDGTVVHGYAHGAAGIARFLLRLHRFTDSPEHLAVAKSLLDFELAHAQGGEESVVWARSPGSAVLLPYWNIGSAGIGRVLLEFHRLLGEPRYLSVARKIAHNLRGTYSVFPGRFAGMAGLGDFLIDMYQHTGEEQYHEEAYRFAERILLFAIEKEHGLVFPGEELVRISTDLATGSAGIGFFFDRLVRGGPSLFRDL